MAEVTLQLASPLDAHRIAPVHVSCWHEAYAGLVPQRCLDDLGSQDRVARWRERLERPVDVTAMALLDGEVVGLATVARHDAGPALPPEELRSLYVVRRRWGCGIGRSLVQLLLAGRPAWLWVFEDSQRARQFYEQTGWQPTGERRHDEWTHVPELRLVRAETPLRAPGHGEAVRAAVAGPRP